MSVYEIEVTYRSVRDSLKNPNPFEAQYHLLEYFKTQLSHLPNIGHRFLSPLISIDWLIFVVEKEFVPHEFRSEFI